MRNAKSTPARRTRVLFHAGRIPPTKPRGPRPCRLGNHAGPLLQCEVFDAAGGMWRDMGICACCGSSVHRSQLSPRAA